MLKRLELADRNAELSARSQIIQGGHPGHIHDPDGFPTKRDNACRHDILNDRIGGFRDQSGRRVNEMQIARAATIDQRIALDRKSRRVPLDQEKTHARLIAFCARNRSEEHTSELQSLMRLSYAV